MTERLTYEEEAPGGKGSLAASQDMATRLSATARKLRFSTSSRSGLYKAVGLRPQLSERLFTVVVVLFTIFYLVVPNALSIVYFGYLASDQYQTEARFTVRSSTPAIGKDQIARVTGIPKAKIVQDTQMVTNYIESRDMLELLEEEIGLRAIYSDPAIDIWARLPDDATIEDRLDYWQDMVTTVINPASGIVTVTVRAFTPETSYRILDKVVSASEIMVNRVNERMWSDITATTRTNLETAKAQLRKASEELLAARNSSGVLTVEGSSLILSNLISTVEGERLKLQQRYDSQIVSISKNAPQMRVLLRDIRSKEDQVAQLRAQFAGEAAKDANLADIQLDFSQLQLAESLAVQQFSSSVKAFEQVQFTSRQQLLYLDTFLKPRPPEEAEYPRRLLWIIGTAIASLLAWGATLGLLGILRNHIAH
jgi:capsular polysaccharide transport system permease protein